MICVVGDEVPRSSDVASRPLVSQVPEWFWEVPYVGARFPGGVQRGTLREGGNCQLWAYELLDHFGFFVPDLRSDELWLDTVWTESVQIPKPLDLVLFARTPDPWGAHVGVWMGQGTVAHLSKEVGYPALWDVDDFAARERYQVVIGSKRARAKTRVTPTTSPPDTPASG